MGAGEATIGAVGVGNGLLRAQWVRVVGGEGIGKTLDVFRQFSLRRGIVDDHDFDRGEVCHFGSIKTFLAGLRL